MNDRLHLPPNAGKLQLPNGAPAPPSEDTRRPAITQDEINELVAQVAELDRTVMLPLDVHSLMALFSAAQLGCRHPAMVGSATHDAVIALTDHLAAELVADDEAFEPLARLLRAGLDPSQDT